MFANVVFCLVLCSILSEKFILFQQFFLLHKNIFLILGKINKTLKQSVSGGMMIKCIFRKSFSDSPFVWKLSCCITKKQEAGKSRIKLIRFAHLNISCISAETISGLSRCGDTLKFSITACNRLVVEGSFEMKLFTTWFHHKPQHALASMKFTRNLCLPILWFMLIRHQIWGWIWKHMDYLAAHLESSFQLTFAACKKPNVDDNLRWKLG